MKESSGGCVHSVCTAAYGRMIHKEVGQSL